MEQPGGQARLIQTVNEYFLPQQVSTERQLHTLVAPYRE